MSADVEHKDSCLTPETLRELYSEQLLTEKEIAERFGTYQVRVNRLRKKWGIPTLGKTGRLEAQLPPLTERQGELITGSLLGDGCMVATSKAAARFEEGHSSSQEGYLRWKQGIFGEYVSSTFPTRKGEHTGVKFNTHSCPQLRPFYDLFYHQGRRVFPKDLHERMTPFMLAIWYMDDGSLLHDFHPRIAFGLSSLSLRRGCQALRALGLKPEFHDSGSIHFPGQADQFFEIIEPYVPKCMAYKRAQESPRRDGDKNARKLTPERAQELYAGGLGLDQIAKLYGVGRSTVRRRLQAVGAPRRAMGRPRKNYSVDAAAVALENYDTKAWAALSTEAQGEWVGNIFAILSKTPFPLPSFEGDAAEELRKLAQREVSCHDGVIQPLSTMGLRLCYPFFPNRYRAQYRTRVSAFEGWHDVTHLRRAIKFQLRVGDPVTPRRVLKALQANCRTPTAFRPTVAKFIYENYCPKGGRVWDPCAGYGGRLLGALAAGVQYIGTDVEPETIEGNRKLAEVLNAEASLTLSPAEKFDPGQVDLVFTSPPYFDREQYSQRGDQSWVQYGDLRSWLEGFLAPVVKTAWRSLSTGQHLILNIADIKVKSEITPLVAETVALAEEVGFTHAETLEMPLSRLNRNAAFEPVLVFRKPDPVIS